MEILHRECLVRFYLLTARLRWGHGHCHGQGNIQSEFGSQNIMEDQE
jgi:hypothetical protein